MLKLNALLIVLVLTSALGVVSAEHRSRKLFSELEHEQTRMRSLEVEWGQLVLEQSTWANHARIETAARKRLGMLPPTNENTVAIQPQELPR